MGFRASHSEVRTVGSRDYGKKLGIWQGSVPPFLTNYMQGKSSLPRLRS